MNLDVLTFAVYLVHAMAQKWGVAPTKSYGVLHDSGCINNYLVKHYDVLHTMGKNALTDDINAYVLQRGYAL